MTSAMIQELADDPRLIHRYTVRDYEQMIAGGVLEEGSPFELLDGQVVRKIRNARGEDPMTIGTEHFTVTTRLGDLNPELKRFGCYIRIQGPLSLPPNDMPEPDGLIVLGSDADYNKRYPTAADVLCVIEVSDASLKRDRGYKQELYAAHGLPMYMIINLADGVVEMYERPLADAKKYSEPTILRAGSDIPFPTAAGSSLLIPVSRLIP